MISSDLQLIDEVIVLIKGKDNTQSTFDLDVLHQFEFNFFLCLEITRFELQTTGQMSDLTGNAMVRLIIFNAFEFYYSDFPNVYEKTGVLFSVLRNYNVKLKNHDLKMRVEKTSDFWKRYFKKVIPDLIDFKKS